MSTRVGQVEIPVQVVVKCQKLQVELWQRQASFSEILVGNDVFVPNDVLSWIQRHFIQGVHLGDAAFVA